MVDYARSLATAQRLIRQSGRLVGLREAATGAANPDNPLAGPDANPAPDTGIPAVFVSTSSLSTLGATTRIQQMLANSDKISIIAPISNKDYKDYRYLIDTDGIEWIIDVIEELKPGNVAVLYFVGISLP